MVGGSVLETRLDSHLKRLLHGYNVVQHAQPKVIRDPLHGCVSIEPYLVSLLDSPLLQRLRFIRQNSLASLVYPAATHTRFEHTLGVTWLAKRFLDRIAESDGVGPQDRLEVLFAAALHDVGHGPFSHSCEAVMRDYGDPTIRSLMDGDLSNTDLKLHEALSYFIIRSDAVRKLIAMICGFHSLPNLDVEHIARYVVGRSPSPERAHLADIINGAFDVDKLDYLWRDAHFTGLKMVVDIDRILCSLGVVDWEGRRRLSVAMSGAHDLEQVLFNKMHLYAAMYHHPKVRAADAMLIELMRMARDGGGLDTEDGRTKLDCIADWVTLSDSDVLWPRSVPAEVLRYAQRIRNRDLPVRAVELSKGRVSGSTQKQNRLWASAMDEPDLLLQLRRDIAGQVGIPASDVLVDLPSPPSIREPSQALVRQDTGTPVLLSKVFSSDVWCAAYTEMKLRGHVFAPREHQSEVATAARDAIAKAFDIAIDESAIERATVRNRPVRRLELFDEAQRNSAAPASKEAVNRSG